jgi:hypothetical protein
MQAGMHKYFYLPVQAMLFFLLLVLSPATASSQQHKLSNQPANKPLNPLLYSSFKKPVKANPLFELYIKPSRFELMYWPNFPLTPEQIAARDRIYDQSLGQQIVGDIIGTGINSLLQGRKLPPAKVPKF